MRGAAKVTLREIRGNDDQRTARTPTATHHEHDTAAGGLWRLRNWRLRTKLLAVLLIPVLTVLGLLGLRVYSDAERSGEFSATVARLEVSAELHEVVGALRSERDLSVRYVAGGRDDGLDEVRAARGEVD